jgi:chemotaxis protein histidine kinase CheA
VTRGHQVAQADLAKSSTELQSARATIESLMKELDQTKASRVCGSPLCRFFMFLFSLVFFRLFRLFCSAFEVVLSLLFARHKLLFCNLLLSSSRRSCKVKSKNPLQYPLPLFRCCNASHSFPAQISAPSCPHSHGLHLQRNQEVLAKLAAAESRAAAAEAAAASASATSKNAEAAFAAKHAAYEMQLQAAAGETQLLSKCHFERLLTSTKTDEIRLLTQRHEQEVALLHHDLDAAIQAAEESEASSNNKIAQVQLNATFCFPLHGSTHSPQARQRADDSDASARLLQQRIDQATQSLATQKQFAEADAALAAADLQSMTKRATQAEQQIRSLQDKLSMNQVPILWLLLWHGIFRFLSLTLRRFELSGRR